LGFAGLGFLAGLGDGRSGAKTGFVETTSLGSGVGFAVCSAVGSAVFFSVGSAVGSVDFGAVNACTGRLANDCDIISRGVGVSSAEMRRAADLESEFSCGLVTGVMLGDAPIGGFAVGAISSSAGLSSPDTDFVFWLARR
jgi:hypothetical protein